jgi:hypothetical protein
MSWRPWAEADAARSSHPRWLTPRPRLSGPAGSFVDIDEPEHRAKAVGRRLVEAGFTFKGFGISESAEHNVQIGRSP